MPPCDHGKASSSGLCEHAPPTLGLVPIDPDDARELSRAAKQITAFTERRNTLIVAIHAKGGGLREIGRIAGLTHRAVTKIIERSQRAD